MSANADKCAYCNITGHGKGKDEFEHIHCRMCLDRGGYGRSQPATGDTWMGWCKGAGRDVTIKAVMLKNRLIPDQHKVPEDMYRDECQMIEIVVGKDPQSKTFVIHEPLLSTSSAYFQRALKTTFKEGREGRVELEDEDPSTFGLLNEYLYTGDVWNPKLEQIRKNRHLHFSSLWLLAHYLQMPKLVNYAMWQIMLWMDDVDKATTVGRYPLIENIYDIYDRAPMESKLRKFLVDLLVWSEWDLKLGQDAPNQMLLDMVAELRRKCGGKAKNPLLDVRVYYTKEEELVPLEKADDKAEEKALEEKTIEGATETN